MIRFRSDRTYNVLLTEESEIMSLDKKYPTDTLTDVVSELKFGKLDPVLAHDRIERIFKQRLGIVATNTPISDKHNLSKKSEGDRDYSMWIYEVALLLDMIIPVKGYSNAQRIEMAVNSLKKQYQQTPYSNE